MRLGNIVNMSKRIDSNALKLLIIVNAFHPDRAGGGAVFSDLCYELAGRGFDVTVRCAYPYYPEWTDKSGRNGWRVWRYQEQGVAVERYGLFIPSRPNSLWRRLIYEGSFFISLLRSLRHGADFDVVMVYCPLAGSVAFASVLKFYFDKPLWLNVQDLPADAATASGISRLGRVNQLLTWVQNALFNRADVWSSISPIMIHRLNSIREHNQPVLYLPNWLHRSLATQIQSFPSKEGRAPENPVKLLYAGNIGEKQDLLHFCQTLQKTDAPFKFRIHGDGSQAEGVAAWIRQIGDARFHFGPFLDETGFAKVLHEADFFVVTEKQNSGGSFIPSKLIPGIASGTPILAVCDTASPLGAEMHTAHVGPQYVWTELDKIPSLIQRTTEQSDCYLQWQANALRRARFYDRERVIDRFAVALRTVAAHPDRLDELPSFDDATSKNDII